VADLTQRDGEAERLEKALALAGIATATLDRAGGTISFDAAAQRLFGIAPIWPAATAARLLDARSLAALRERFARGG
jgi:PAS domain-containing protein